jgi:hypothetical protein
MITTTKIVLPSPKMTTTIAQCNPSAGHQPGCSCMMGNCIRYDPSSQHCCKVRRGSKVCSEFQTCGGESIGTFAECVDKTVATSVTTTRTVTTQCSPIVANQPGCCCMMGNCVRYDPSSERCCKVRLGSKICSKDQTCGGESTGTVAECVDP